MRNDLPKKREVIRQNLHYENKEIMPATQKPFLEIQSNARNIL